MFLYLNPLTLLFYDFFFFLHSLNYGPAVELSNVSECCEDHQTVLFRAKIYILYTDIHRKRPQQRYRDDLIMFSCDIKSVFSLKSTTFYQELVRAS